MVHSEPMWTRAGTAHPSSDRRRRHGHRAAPGDRRALELAGWRTLLEYRENHVRDQDGTLLAVMPQWMGEAEFGAELGSTTRRPGRPSALVATATGQTPAAVWAELRRSTAAAGPRIDAPCQRLSRVGWYVSWYGHQHT